MYITTTNYIILGKRDLHLKLFPALPVYFFFFWLEVSVILKLKTTATVKQKTLEWRRLG